LLNQRAKAFIVIIMQIRAFDCIDGEKSLKCVHRVYGFVTCRTLFIKLEGFHIPKYYSMIARI